MGKELPNSLSIAEISTILNMNPREIKGLIRNGILKTKDEENVFIEKESFLRYAEKTLGINESEILKRKEKNKKENEKTAKIMLKMIELKKNKK